MNNFYLSGKSDLLRQFGSLSYPGGTGPLEYEQPAPQSRDYGRSSGIRRVKQVNSGVEVTSILPACALAISDAM